jgi:transmembrane sensor
MTENRLVALLCEIATGEEPGELPAEVQRWAALSPENEAVVKVAVDGKVRGEELQLYGKPDPDEAYARWQASMGKGDMPETHIPRFTRSRWVAAAVIAAMISVGMVVVKVVRQQDKTISASSAPVIPAGRNTATLTLASGRAILLDTAKPGELAVEGNTLVTKTDTAGVVYSHSVEGGTVGVDVLTTPRAGQYRLTLPDGSRVWLNSASQLWYPPSFEGNTRTVALSGEAYFEVTADAAKPFYVIVNGREKIQVLGTAFNIMAYPNEDNLRTTLITGVVRVITSKQTVQLKPEEQAKVDSLDRISIVTDVSAEDIASWKDGFFYFEETPFKAVMRQLARWYDVEIVYKTDPGETPFSGSIRRSTPLNDIVKYFKTDQVQCRLEGRQLIVETQ